MPSPPPTIPMMDVVDLTDGDDDDVVEVIPIDDEFGGFLDEAENDDEEDGDNTTPTRNLDPLPPSCFLSQCTLSGDLNLGPTARTIRPGDTVELHDGTFLRILLIIQDLSTDAITLRGLWMHRNNAAAPMLERKLNEVHIKASLDTWDPRPLIQQALEERPLSMAARKRNLIITAAPFPHESFRDRSKERTYTFLAKSSPGYYQVQQGIRDHGVLVCRHVYAWVFQAGERERSRKFPYRGILRPITAAEADEGGMEFRGTGKTKLEARQQHSPSPPPRARFRKRREYTYGDCFCCAGGATRGAVMAGLKPMYGFDKDPQACTSWAANFSPGARVFESLAHHFPPEEFRAHVDVLHLSPPCQPFSPAKTVACPHDETNEASLWAVDHLVGVIKPRVVTIEQTSGLLERHQLYFKSLIGMLARQGYSCQYQNVCCSRYGLAQTRKRLFVIATAPGERAIDFPPATHGHRAGLLPLATIFTAASNIPAWSTDHDINGSIARDLVPTNPHKTALTVTCGNASSTVHWDGTRNFTVREMAAIQGFPAEHVFEGGKTAKLKQIGNACPPVVMKAVFGHVVKRLAQWDDERERARERDGARSMSRTLSPVAVPVAPRGGVRNLDAWAAGSSPEDAIMLD